MFSFIKGKVHLSEEGSVTLETQGVGWEIQVSTATASALSGKTEASLFTYLMVKEDGMMLYGFLTQEEKRMFLRLVTVSGVGPKVAMSVLSGLSLRDLAVSIANEDTAMLSRIKGIGKKTAERIILELKEKVSADLAFAGVAGAGRLSDGDAVPLSGVASDACAALMALGLRRTECLAALKKAQDSGAATAEELIAAALKLM